VAKAILLHCESIAFEGQEEISQIIMLF